MQPTHKDVCLDATLELQSAQRSVHNGGIQVAAALRGSVQGHFAKDAKDHGNIVRRKAPQNVLFSPELPKIQPRRVDVQDFSEVALLDQSVELGDRRVVLENVPHHQHGALRVS